MCMMKLATDRTINGKLIYSSFTFSDMLLTILGHSLMVTPRSVAKEGFKDVGMDDHTEDGYFKKTQEVQLRIIGDKWVPELINGRSPEGGKKLGA